MRTVSVAIERIRIGHGCISAGVSIAREISAADNFRCRESAGLDDRSIVAGVGRDSTWTTEVRVRVVDACVDDRNLYALARVSARSRPGARRFDKGRAARVVDCMDRQPVDCFHVGVRSELRQDAGIDLRGDAVVGGLHTIKDTGVAAVEPKLREHTLLRTANSCHLRACGTCRSGASLRVSGAVALIAERARVDSRGGLVQQFDHHVHFARFGKLIEVADGIVVCVLRAIEVVALSVGDVISSID